ncbi:MAG: hypothetical protein QF805_10095, partial [Pirellulaceae bacterium]|nr:hypothetical protein [Pirellulaceae bacterium]
MNLEMQPSSQPSPRATRRDFLGATAAGASLFALPHIAGAAPMNKRPRVAAVFTVFTYRSHGHVILENFLEKYLFNGKLTDPGVDVVSFYADQLPGGDMSRDVGRKYKVPMFKTIREALCVGGDKLAVDAVLSIGEHGDYPTNALGQREYPRKRFFDEIVAVMRDAKRFVPLFNDKHLSYRWDEAKAMYDEARRLGIPLMAGSSVPLAQRRPPLGLPAGAEMAEAVSVHGGPLESYDFHALEVLQSIVESRQGGETGVSRVEFLQGDAVWQAARGGRWSLDLAQAAMNRERGDLKTLTTIPGEQEHAPHALLLTFKDGLRATILKVGRSDIRWNFACRLNGDAKIHSTAYYVGPWHNRNLFKALSHAIQHHFIHGKAPYPVERTLLVTGVLEAAMRARQAGEPVATPELEFDYAPIDFTAMREMGESWKIITEKTPQPPGVNPLGIQ